VNSKRGTQFRIWATGRLREHLLRGYTLNERRLREKGLGEMEQAVGLLARTLKRHDLVTDEGRAVLEVVEQYARSWRLLLEYDERRLAEAPLHPRKPTGTLALESARSAIGSLRRAVATDGSAPGLFGQERGDQLGAILGNVEQTFDGAPLYPSVQARAAHLLYFLIKDHPFSDGNKRIGTLLFLEYLRRNGMLVRADGAFRLADNTMVAHGTVRRTLRSACGQNGSSLRHRVANRTLPVQSAEDTSVHERVREGQLASPRYAKCV
jgi:prophage maintenance system killer protein